MPRFFDPTTKEVTFIGSPELNPDLVKGKIILPDQGTAEEFLGTPAGQQAITGATLAPSTTLNLQQPGPVGIPAIPTGEFQPAELSPEERLLRAIFG